MCASESQEEVACVLSPSPTGEVSFRRQNNQLINILHIQNRKGDTKHFSCSSESPVNTQDGRFLFVDGFSHLIYILHLGKAITANVSHRC